MTDRDTRWEAWVNNHANPIVARHVLSWLTKGNYEEELWAQADALVELVVTTPQG